MERGEGAPGPGLGTPTLRGRERRECLQRGKGGGTREKEGKPEEDGILRAKRAECYKRQVAESPGHCARYSGGSPGDGTERASLFVAS